MSEISTQLELLSFKAQNLANHANQRIHTKCVDVTEKNPGQFLVKNEVTMEIKGVDKPAYIAETLSLYIT